MHLCPSRCFPCVDRASYRHDPDAEGAIVVKVPTKEHAAKHNKKYGGSSRLPPRIPLTMTSGI